MTRIVVLDHGGRQAQRLAGRLRRHGDVVVVRAVRSGDRPWGSVAVAEALRDGSGVGLVVHDDVTFADHGVDTLLSAHAAGAQIAAAVPAGGRPEPVVRAMPGMWVGDAQELAAEFDRWALADPRLALRRARGIVAVPVPGYRHEERCIARAAARTLDELEIVATLIVRDEEAVLEDCLLSLRGFVDRVVVCDTGSTDATMQIARRHGATVIERPWRDDFAWARNEAIAAAGDPHLVLVIDADERLTLRVSPQRVRRAIGARVGDAEAFQVTIVDGGGHRFSSVRLFDPHVARYEGALHEMPVRIVGDRPLRTGRLDGVSLLHLGYAPDIVARKGKATRNIAIAEEAYRRDPSPRHALDLARSLAMARSEPGRIREICATLDDAQVGQATRGHIRKLEADAARWAGDPDADRLLIEAWELVPADLTVGADVAERLLARDEPARLVELAERLAEAPSPDPIFQKEEGAGRLACHLATAYARIGRGDGALRQARDAVDVGADTADMWTALLDASPTIAPTAVADLARRARTAAFVGPVARLVGVPAVAAIAAERVAATAHDPDPELVKAAFVTALVAGAVDELEKVLEAADALDAADLAVLAWRAEARGASDLAAHLRGRSLAASGAFAF